MSSVFDTVHAPLEWIVAWLMVGFHTNFSAVGPPAASGLTWGLSIAQKPGTKPLAAADGET